jgi:Helix-turn-helix
VPNDTEDYSPKRFSPICADSPALLLPDHVVAAAAGESACKGNQGFSAFGYRGRLEATLLPRRLSEIHNPLSPFNNGLRLFRLRPLMCQIWSSRKFWPGEYTEFTRRIIVARKDAGGTQQQLAERIRKPQSFVSKYERGER